MEEFEWDEANRKKNWKKHRVSVKECEEVFFDKSLVIAEDPKHSEIEKRFSALGKTESGRTLTIFFTTRDNKIRVISARDQSKKERRTYEEASKKA